MCPDPGRRLAVRRRRRPRRRRRGAVRPTRCDGQQRRHLRRGLEVAAGDDRGRLGRDHGGQPPRGVPVLQAGDRGDDRTGARRRGPRPGHQHLLPARHDRASRAPRLRHQQGRGGQPHPSIGRRLRPAWDPRQRDRAGQDHDPPARGVRPRGDGLFARPDPVRAAGPAGGCGRRGGLPGVRRLALRLGHQPAGRRRLDGVLSPPASPGGAPAALRVGLIGAGWISESHLPHIEAGGDARLVAVCDTDLARAEAISRPRGARAYVDWEEMLDADRLDAVWVCTPPLHHRAPTLAALERGIHVYLEKPIARDVSEGEAIVAAAEGADAVCVVGYQWRGTELLQRVRELVSPRDVAMLVSRNYGPVAARGWFMDPQQSGGQILERASHHIDLQRAIGGEVVAVRTVGSSVALAQAGQPSATIEDALALTLEFATGAVGTIGVAWTPPDHPLGACPRRDGCAGVDRPQARPRQLRPGRRGRRRRAHRQLRRPDAPLGAALPGPGPGRARPCAVLHSTRRAGDAGGGRRVRAGAGHRRPGDRTRIDLAGPAQPTRTVLRAGRRRVRRLEPAQLRQRYVAADPVPGLLLAQVRLGGLADLADLARAPGVKRAARRRIGGAGDVALQADPQAVGVVERRDRRQQGLGIGVVRALEHVVGRPDLHHPAEVEHHDAVGQVADDAEVVADEQVGHVLALLQVGEQVEDRRLHRHVERGGRLVADHDPGVAGKRAGDRDALFEPARQLGWAHRQIALREPHRLDQRQEPVLELVTAVAAQLGQGAGDQLAHRMAAVERRIGILEDDLQRLLIGCRSLGGLARHRVAVEASPRRPHRVRSGPSGPAPASSCRSRTHRPVPPSPRRRCRDPPRGAPGRPGRPCGRSCSPSASAPPSRRRARRGPVAGVCSLVAPSGTVSARSW